MKAPSKVLQSRNNIAVRTESLTIKETSELAKCESEITDAIAKGAQLNLQVARNLWAIKDGGLYLSTHKTFESYCNERWSFSKQRAYQLLAAAEQVESLPKKSQQLLTNEGQARALKKAPKEAREKIIREVAKTGPVTAKRIASQVTEDIKDADFEELDALGSVIPKAIMSEWKRATTEATKHMNAVSEIKSWLNAGIGNDPIFSELNRAMVAELTLKYREIKSVKPHIICPDCKGAKCKSCHKRGFISEFYSKQFGK